jgi:hypothetical protein
MFLCANVRQFTPPLSAMAARDHHYIHAKKIPLFPLLSLLCFASIFLVLSFSRKTSSNPSHSQQTFRFRHTRNPDPNAAPDWSCDYSEGAWIRDPDRTGPRYDGTCKEIFKGWNCISNNKSNGRELTSWRWKPRRCDLPPFDPVSFLEKYRDTSIGTLSQTKQLVTFCLVDEKKMKEIELQLVFVGAYECGTVQGLLEIP